jgi:hypothetical protein
VGVDMVAAHKWFNLAAELRKPLAEEDRKSLFGQRAR